MKAAARAFDAVHLSAIRAFSICSSSFLIFFGAARCEKDAPRKIPRTLDDAGRISEKAHPWALMLKNDLETLCGTSAGESFDEV